MNERTPTLDDSELADRIRQQRPDNSDRREGFALVNVLSPETFENGHIPGSINIPKGSEDEFERRFDKDKEIVVYCASPECDASPQVAEELARRGFLRVQDFETGLSSWSESGREVARGGA